MASGKRKPALKSYKQLQGFPASGYCRSRANARYTMPSRGSDTTSMRIQMRVKSAECIRLTLRNDIRVRAFYLRCRDILV